MLALLFASNTLGETIKVKEVYFYDFTELKNAMKKFSEPDNVFRVLAQWGLGIRMAYYKNTRSFVQYNSER